MKRPTNLIQLQALLIGGLSLLFSVTQSSAFERYNDGCNDCHGKFTEAISPKTPPTIFPEGNKHVMHGREGTYMNTDCDLCHTSGDSRNPYLWKSNGTGTTTGLGCSGCHVGAGLRQHHAVNGIDLCGDCHDPEAILAENINPPYYGSIDTLADNPCNDVQAANTGENWSVGDFVGLDNDGDNLYDQADFDCGPPYRLLSAVPEGSNLRVRWETVGGRVDAVQASPDVQNGYLDVSTLITNAGVGVMTNEFLEIGGAANDARFYRIRDAH